MKNHATPSTSARRPLWLITASILVAHALVLQAMPLAQSAHTPTPAPTQVFYARTIATPATVPMPATQPVNTTTAAPHRPGKVRLHTASTPPPAATTEISIPTQHAALTAGEPPWANNTPSPPPLPPDATTAVPTAAPESLQTEGATASVLVASASKHPPRGTPHPNSNSAQEIISASHQILPGNAAVRVPAPLRMEFDVLGRSKKFQYRANAELLWQHDEQSYQARQEIKVLFLGSRTQSSKGDITPSGLRPLQFNDQSRREQTAQFDYESKLIRFNTNSPEAPLLPGTQDRLSIFIQLGALLAAAPERYPTGTRIQVTTAGGSNANQWTFRVEGTETLELPAGSFSTLKLQRLPRDNNDNDQQAELWLAPRLNYLPARIQLTQSNGDFADLRLSSHSKP